MIITKKMSVLAFQKARWQVEHTTAFEQHTLRVIVAQHALCLADFVSADIAGDKLNVFRVGARLCRVHDKWRDTLVHAIGGRFANDPQSRDFDDVVDRILQRFSDCTIVATDELPASCVNFYERLTEKARHAGVQTARKFKDYTADTHHLMLLGKNATQEDVCGAALSCLYSALALGMWLDAILK